MWNKLCFRSVPPKNYLKMPKIVGKTFAEFAIPWYK
jgi:hypothetical protein